MRARSFTDGIVAHGLGLDLFPERGTRRDDLRPGLRATTFRRRVTIAFHVAIAFHVTGAAVVIDRILRGGRDMGRAFGERDDA